MLEDRLAPALTFRFDYSLDGAGFFADPAARAALEQSAADLGSRIVSTPVAIAPGGGDSWQAVFHHPTTGAEVRLTNPTIPQGTVVVYAGGANLGPGEAGEGGPGGYTVSGSRSFVQAVSDRPGAGGVWGGSLSFDTDTNWYLGADPAGRATGQIDLYSVAVHELGHLLGFGTAPEFAALVNGGTFAGTTATAVYGSAPPLASDGSHWRRAPAPTASRCRCNRCWSGAGWRSRSWTTRRCRTSAGRWRACPGRRRYRSAADRTPPPAAWRPASRPARRCGKATRSAG